MWTCSENYRATWVYQALWVGRRGDKHTFWRLGNRASKIKINLNKNKTNKQTRPHTRGRDIPCSFSNPLLWYSYIRIAWDTLESTYFWVPPYTTESELLGEETGIWVLQKAAWLILMQPVHQSVDSLLETITLTLSHLKEKHELP